MDPILHEAATRAARYIDEMPDAPVRPDPNAGLSWLDEPMPDGPTDPVEVVRLLDERLAPATMRFGSPRFFGWVIGAAYPVSVATDWLASAWDQNTVVGEASPGTVAMEVTALRWMASLFGLPETVGGAFVTGTTVANMVALAVARNHVLEQVGWDSTAHGLFGAPPVTVVVGEEVHPSLVKALGFVGLGRERVTRVPVDDQGRMRADALPAIDGPTIVCVQAGNVNTGGFDPFPEIVPGAREAGAWVHVDGAFGIWAAVSPRLSHLTRGLDEADSWAADAHKWLNVPYDAGVFLTKNPEASAKAIHIGAAYLLGGNLEDPAFYTPELSRRARGLPTWATLKALGREGVVELVERCCDLARRFATGLTAAGFEILNDVVLNQVLVSFGDPEETRRVIGELQREGTMFAGPTVWQGNTAMRISVSSYRTTEADVDRCVEVIAKIARS